MKPYGLFTAEIGLASTLLLTGCSSDAEVIAQNGRYIGYQGHYVTETVYADGTAQVIYSSPDGSYLKAEVGCTETTLTLLDITIDGDDRITPDIQLPTDTRICSEGSIRPASIGILGETVIQAVMDKAED